MKIYFLSSMPCSLSLNEVFFGITDNFERYAEINLSDRIFAKFTPEGALPISFFITEKLLSEPPIGCEVYLLHDGIALFARDFPPCDFSVYPIAQERINDCLLTVFRQGVLQFSLQTEYGFFIVPLPIGFLNCKLFMHADLCFIEGENCLAVYTKKGECVLLEQIVQYEIEENELHATLPLSDSLGRIAECIWTLHENGCTRTQFTLKQAQTTGGETAPNKIAEELLPFAFFESVLIGADYTEFLSDALTEKAEDVRSFLGDFVSVTLTKNPTVCGLVRKKAERLFEVAYFTVEKENGKITDIKSGIKEP